MIMTFHLKRDGPAVANIDHPGVFFARFHQNVRAGRRKFFQLAPRIFIRAMLAPHHRENSQLSEIWFAPKNFSYAIKFFRRKTLLFNKFRSYDGVGIGVRLTHRQTHVNASRASVEFAGNESRKRKGRMMKKTLIILVCALIAPLAFAQTSTTTTQETTTEPATTTTTTTYTAGTVTTYEPGKTVVVKSPEGPVSFAFGTAARIIDGAG